MKKIALCISGHFKYYNELYQNFLDFCYNPLKKYGDVDVFVSTWSQLHTSYSASHFFGHCTENIGQTNIEDIKEKYHAKKIIVKNYEVIKKKFHYKKLFIEDKPYIFTKSLLKNDIYIPIGMYYQWYLCNQLKIQEEEKNGGKI